MMLITVFLPYGKVFTNMKKELILRGKLRVALRPHLETLRNRKRELTPRDFVTLLETTRDEFGKNPKLYLTGIADDAHSKMVIESIFDELLEE